jgi:hypothetical protein
MDLDKRMAEKLRQIVEREGDQVTDLRLWRLGADHLGAIGFNHHAAGARAGLLPLEMMMYRMERMRMLRKDVSAALIKNWSATHNTRYQSRHL